MLHFNTFDGFNPSFSLNFMLFIWIVNHPEISNFQAVCKHLLLHPITFLASILSLLCLIDLSAFGLVLVWISSLGRLILIAHEPLLSLSRLAAVYLTLCLKLILLSHSLLVFTSILNSIHPFPKYVCYELKIESLNPLEKIKHLNQLYQIPLLP